MSIDRRYIKDPGWPSRDKNCYIWKKKIHCDYWQNRNTEEKISELEIEQEKLQWNAMRKGQKNQLNIIKLWENIITA